MTPMDAAWFVLKGSAVRKVDESPESLRRRELQQGLMGVGGSPPIEVDQLQALLNQAKPKQAWEEPTMEERLSEHARGDNEPLGDAPPSPLARRPVAVQSTARGPTSPGQDDDPAPGILQRR
jgi:hypothetical protein